LKRGTFSLLVFLCAVPPLWAVGLPTRPERVGGPRGEPIPRLDGPAVYWLGDGTRLKKESGARSGIDAVSALVRDTRQCMYYSWSGGRVGGRRISGKLFLLTWSTNLKPDTPFGADVRRLITVPDSKAGAKMFCTQGADGQWRGLTQGTGKVEGAAAEPIRDLVGEPRFLQWALVVSDINQGKWVSCRLSEARSAKLKRFVRSKRPKATHVGLWFRGEEKPFVYGYNVLGSFHKLLLEDMTRYALNAPPGAAAEPAEPPPPQADPPPSRPSRGRGRGR
jgi:hypothetical protein